ncbi:hypothetical protein [Corynebacterium variabile]|uniref:Uncharacterized protein n=1 Tax=Corynebacterium variabile TaxID=1727 RepID=A0A110BGK8_9CORY|nr:hypothetical protein [Corynebacterium variabile]CUU65393.1 hypothetical protein CVAR292_00712 [Corynebacterium variabile]
MGRIPGYYEWDDDRLSPGNKKEGGLHQNLFDEDGNLKGSARFIPSEESEPSSVDVTEHMFVTTEERRLSREQEELLDAVVKAAVAALCEQAVKAAPHVKQWWNSSFRPFLSKQRDRIPNLTRGKKHKAGDILDPVVDDNTHQDRDLPAVTDSEPRPKMSAAEAQARYLAAMAAHAYSEQQLALLNSADIIDSANLAEIQNCIAELPPHQVRELMTQMVSDPSMLTEDNLAMLASLLDRTALPPAEQDR